MLLKISIVFAAVLVVQTAGAIDRVKLRFKISARGLPDKDKLGTIDPYVEIYSIESGRAESRFGKSDTISDNENPDWGTVFEYDFDRAKSQVWKLKIYDDDNLREDDGAGKTYVNVADYVDRGQLLTTNLEKKGYVIIKSIDPVPDPAPGFVRGVLPLPYGTADTMTLKFKLSANNLPDKDNLGKTDPYVELYYSEGITGREKKFGRSGTLTNTKNPSWGETFEFSYDRRKEQRWHFKVYDNDNFREDDNAGRVWVDVNDYVAKGQLMTVHLSKKLGTLTITRADGISPGITYIPINMPTGPSYAQAAGGNKYPNQPATPPYPAHQQQPGISQYPTQPQQPGIPPYPVQPQQQPGIAPYPGQPQQQQPGIAPYPGQPQQQQPGKPYHTAAPISVQGPTPSQPILVDQGIKLRFRLSAKNLEDRDLIGTSDPYVKIFATQDGSTAETLVGTTSVKEDNENPDWSETFEFTFEKSRRPRWRFLVLDEDANRSDDELGNVTIDVSDFINKNGPLTVSLKKGSLTITRI